MKKGVLLFILLSALALFAQQTGPKDPAPAPVGTWEQIGPEGVYVEDLAANPGNPNEIWLVTGSHPAQVFKTANGGQTWSLLSTIDTDRHHVGDLAVDPVNPGVIYASGTSALNKSVDGGLTWHAYPYGAGLYTNSGRIAVSSSHPNLIYISGHYGYPSDRDGMAVFKSPDGGLTWSDKPTPSTPNSATDLSLALDPTNPDTLYLGGYEYDGTSHGHIYKSTDGGGNWIDITGIIQGYVYALAVDPALPSRVYAGTDSGIYRSMDGGMSWTPSSDPASAFELAIDPSNPGTVYAGAVDTCYKSVNYGENWAPSAAGLHGSCKSLIVAPPSVFFGAGDIYKTTDGGISWQTCHSGIRGVSVSDLTTAPSAPGTIYAGFGADLLKSTDYGNNWSQISGAGGWQFVVNPSNASELLIRRADGIYRSVDGGSTSTKIGDRPRGMVVNRFDFNRIFVLGVNEAGARTLFKTTDGGANWSAQDISSLPSFIYAFDIDPTIDSTIYVGGYYDTFLGNVRERNAWIEKSTDGGLSWTRVFHRHGFIVRMISVDPYSPNRVFAGTSGGLYKSEDYGDTWQFVLPGDVPGIEVNPASNGEVYAVVDYEIVTSPQPANGVWASMDWGGSWLQMNSGLTVTSITGIAVNWNNRILYASAERGGVFRTFLPGPPARPTISGVVKTAGGQGMPGVQLTFSNGGGTVTRGASGFYVQPVPAGWSGTVTPSKPSCIFTPADRSYMNVASNQAGQDYAEYVHTVSTPTTPNGLPRGEKNSSYTFTTGGAACTQGHGVEYQYDWGDGSFTGWSSAASASHSWSTPGEYTVKARARCSVDINLVSGWSPGTVVTILTQYTEADKHAVGDFNGDGLDEAAVDFGTLGVWLWNGGVWGLLTSSNPEHLIADNLDGDADDEIIGDFGSDGIWACNGGTWGLLSGQNPELMVKANTDGDPADEIFADFGYLGIWLYNGGTWSQLIGVFAEYMAAVDTDGDAADELAADLGFRGLWLWDGGTWTQLTEDDPEYMIAANTDGDSAGELVVDFGSLGLWLWNGGAWTYLSNDNPEFMAAGDTDGDGADEVAVDFGGMGVFLLNAGTWNYLTPDNPDFLLMADVNGNGDAEIVADFGGIGLWLWDSGTWTYLTSDNPQYLTRANTDGDADQEFIADFGPLGLFLWNNNTWTCLTNDNPD